MWHKKLISFFVHHKFLIFNFYIVNWQHVDQLCSGPGNKKPLIHLSLTCLIYRSSYLELLWKKNICNINICINCKISVKGSHFSKIAGHFQSFFEKLTLKQVFFKDFGYILSNFSLCATFPEGFPMADSVHFKISFR